MWGTVPGIWGCSGLGTHNSLRLHPGQGGGGAGEEELGGAATAQEPDQGSDPGIVTSLLCDE